MAFLNILKYIIILFYAFRIIHVWGRVHWLQGKSFYNCHWPITNCYLQRECIIGILFSLYCLYTIYFSLFSIHFYCLNAIYLFFISFHFHLVLVTCHDLISSSRKPLLCRTVVSMWMHFSYLMLAWLYLICDNTLRLENAHLGYHFRPSYLCL